jgi:transcriptional regulator with XRE-family HTH domain
MTKREIQRWRKEIGNILKGGREIAGLSQEKVAKKLRMPARTLINYEQGKHTMGWIRYMEICEVLGMDAGKELSRVIHNVYRRQK